MDPMNTLPVVRRKYNRQPADSVHPIGFHYSRGMMSFFFRTAGNPPSTAIQFTLDVDGGRLVVNVRVSMALIDCRHRQNDNRLPQEGKGLLCSVQLFRMRQ